MFAVWCTNGLRGVFLALTLTGLAACQTTQSSGPAAPATPKADYTTYSDHFAALQRAGLAGNYTAFAGLLKPQDSSQVTTALQTSFRGGPFDVYTQKSAETNTSHERLVELRSTGGRLYLYLKLDKVPGGWALVGYDLGRNRAAVSARLSKGV